MRRVGGGAAVEPPETQAPEDEARVQGRAEACEPGTFSPHVRSGVGEGDGSERPDRLLLPAATPTHAMAVLGRQVLGLLRHIPLTWVCLAKLNPYLGEQKRTTASLLRKLTTASGGESLEELPLFGSKKCVQELECQANLVHCLPEKQRTSVDGGPLTLEKVVCSLLDMGFSDTRINELLGIQPGASLQQLLDIISEFILLGVNPESVYVALKKSPQLLNLPIVQVKKRSSYLRKLGLGEGKLKKVLHSCPEIFTMRQQDVDEVVQVLKEKCLFTVQQVTEILHRCPNVLREDPSELEYKFQYGYFRMGSKHLDIVRTEFFKYSLTKIKQRHIYLERLGRYQTPDKKGQTQIANPLLKDILRVSEAEFLAKTACSSAEEFAVFKKLLAWEDEELESSISQEEEEEEEEEDEDEDKDEE
ncbi:transcription termination factor 4, mitochondrial [Fukomys damarensis]|uniref:Transcription termination factor 4, mitochondrial n=1 Tax=Fukomys damarensis TaxID=885580 RepID=A0A091CT38_FUKDA|nr:transcription termination factor 4, mitochondrial [Fukomys damarensis]KFO22549.1 mTERF domain-containing protein 2 [Fukomys damarensis]